MGGAMTPPGPPFVDLSPLEASLLGLLQRQHLSGYDLRKLFRDTPLMRFSDSPGSIYPALRRLEKRGWLEATVKPSDSIRQRQAYAITPAGLEAFRAWRGARVTRDDVIWKLDVVMLRFAFSDNATARRILRDMIRELDTHVRALRAFSQAASGLTITGRLALESGLAGFDAQLRWAKRAIVQLGTKQADG
jgi:DNA-binding PadR family transcriptional regulator